ncbi:serine/threonine protein kinase [Jatrophihabitans endophyticus]|uniref:non-specific serine/threonine protein kinase n=1 Tax=Jatrophihabitans endophyticus TaxID=1206085 RepID=A0A1M5L6C9_9ACTN|nr:Stk1 family PASTA domain-containing Ser/Thr kinase [Jatrophihabitans endophyticus]SHG60349.1 serine/threonine protein kinase [Jatrophihabitans endophyticus]
MKTAAADSLVGRTLEGRYRILDRIARGGMSTVYAAVDERLDRMVAVKVMSSALSADPAFSDRFAREARAAARLAHLNVVSVYDQGHEIAQDGHHVFLVMELVEGRTLRELLRERGRLSPAEAVSIMESVLSALAAAHRAGLVHRDVKPENILLSDEGVVKVADFGLARAVETDPSSTRTGLMMGTVAYCAPEQLSRGHADPRSDVYAAGIVLFELLTGEPPYTGESAMNVAYQHVHSRVPAPSSRLKRDGTVPSEIDEIVVAATDSDPTGRPADAGALLAELSDVRGELGLPITPVPPRVRPAPHRPDHRSQRRPTPERATTDALRSGAGADTVMVSDAASPHDTTRLDDRRSAAPARGAGDPPPPVVIPPARERDLRRRRRRRSLIGLLVVIAVGLAAFFGAKAFIEWRFAHVPDVAGGSLTDARHTLEHAGYDVRVNEGKEPSETVPANHVLSTDPQIGSRLPTGKTVTLTLSAGKQTWVIPQTKGRSVQEALVALSATGDLTVKQPPRLRFDDRITKGDVIGTDPAAGNRVNRDQPVTIIVSNGPPAVAVPDIPVGTPLDQAKATIEGKKFVVQTDGRFSDDVAEGGVISVSPSGKATKGSTVTLTYSRGPEMVTVPDIPRGTKVDAASQTIRDANLVPVVKRLIGVGDEVLSTSPGKGSKLRAGSSVTLFVIPG